jgi:hypothetical protein
MGVRLRSWDIDVCPTTRVALCSQAIRQALGEKGEDGSSWMGKGDSVTQCLAPYV